MPVTFFMIFFKNLLRQKFIAFINILGLTVGLSVFILLFLYVEDEYSWDSQWNKADQIVRMNFLQMTGGMVNNTFGMAPPGAWSRLADFFPDEIETSTMQYILGTNAIEVDGKKSDQNGLVLVPPSFVEVFRLQELRGSLQASLEAPGRLALNEADALRYFGTIDVIGRKVAVTTIDDVEHELEVAAVFRVPQRKSAVRFYSFSLLDGALEPKLEEKLEAWLPLGTTTYQYHLLKDGADVDLMNARMDVFQDQYATFSGIPAGVDTTGMKINNILKLRLQKLRDVHFNPVATDQRGEQFKAGIFASIAVLILLIGTVNYVILTTAQSIDRKREIGVKKTAGATSRELMLQFIGESLVYSSFALLLAAAIAELVLPAFSTLIGHQLILDLSRWQTGGFLLLVALIVGVAGGFYPGLVLSRFRPEKVLRSAESKVSAGSSTLRSLLLGLQFAIAIGMILASLVLYLQLEFIRSKAPGFNATNIASVYLRFVNIEQSQVDALMNSIRSLSGVEELTLAGRSVNETEIARENRSPFTRVQENSPDVPLISLSIDQNFMHVYQIPILAGRDFDAELDAIPIPGPPAEGSREKVLLSLMAAVALGFSSAEDAAGATIYRKLVQPDGIQRYAALEVIGVVADNQFLSQRDAPVPMIYQLPSFSTFLSSIQVRLTRGYEATFTEAVEKLWSEIVGEGYTRVSFAEESMKGVFNQERNEGKLMMFFAALAILVSCLGLYGIVMFELRRRTKEIGIRKALGSDVHGLVRLFLLQFVRPVLFANIVAWPLTLWGMLQWLQRFPYQMDKVWLLPLCLLAALLVLLIAMFTVFVITANAAGAKPLKSLRYE